MYEAKPNANSMVETTDCLETVGVFRSAKNFFFIIIVIALLATQAVFWLGRFDVIDWDTRLLSAVDNDKESLQDINLSQDTKSQQVNEISDKPKELTSIAKDAQEAIESVKTDIEIDASGKVAVEELTSKPVPSKTPHRIDWAYLKVIVNLANAVVVFSVVCYTLVLVFSLKVSLVGKLGGLSHISSAFLISLFAVLVILPWQLSFPGVHLFGTIFTAQELQKWLISFSDDGIIVKILCYVRFVFTFILAIWLLVWAQLRSRRWSRATLKRLGIMQ